MQDPLQQMTWFNYMYAKYVPFMVRERFAIDSAPLEQEESEVFKVCIHALPLLHYRI